MAVGDATESPLGPDIAFAMGFEDATPPSPAIAMPVGFACATEELSDNPRPCSRLQERKNVLLKLVHA